MTCHRVGLTAIHSFPLSGVALVTARWGETDGSEADFDNKVVVMWF